MKKWFVSLVLCAVVGGASASAQAADLAQIQAQRDAGISQISSQVRDIEARYWADRVLRKQLTLSALEAKSAHWLGEKEENERLMALVRQWVQKGSVPPLTPQEVAQLEENRQQVRQYLNGTENPAARALAEKNRKITQIEQPVFDLEARYWAWRIAVVQDLTLDELYGYSENWVGEKAANRKLVMEVEKNIKEGNTAPLSKKEQKKLEANRQKVRQLLQ